MENIVLESDIIWREKMWNSIWLQYPDITKNVQYPSAIVYWLSYSSILTILQSYPTVVYWLSYWLPVVYWLHSVFDPQSESVDHASLDSLPHVRKVWDRHVCWTNHIVTLNQLSQ